MSLHQETVATVLTALVSGLFLSCNTISTEFREVLDLGVGVQVIMTSRG